LVNYLSTKRQASTWATASASDLLVTNAIDRFNKKVLALYNNNTAKYIHDSSLRTFKLNPKNAFVTKEEPKEQDLQSFYEHMEWLKLRMEQRSQVAGSNPFDRRIKKKRPTRHSQRV
jgi:hypothetical protein